MNKTIAICLMTLAIGGCKKKHGGGGGDNEVKSEELPDAVMAWAPKTTAEAWAGAWKGRMTLSMGGTHSMAGDHAAFDIKGDKATVFDGKTETPMDFVIESPCQARFDQAITEGNMKGGTSYHHIIFVVKDGKAMLGGGAAGYRKGKTAMFCTEGMEGGNYTLDDKGVCTHYKDRFGKWETTTTDCKWSTADGKDLLTVGTGDWATKLYGDGDLLISEQFTGEAKYYEKAADFASAKTEIAARVKKDDPLEKVKAAGGKPGDTTTVLGLTATYLSDKSLKGKPIEMTALYLNSNSGSDGKNTYYNAMIVDAKDQSEFAISCETAAEVKDLVQYDKVTIKGTIDDGMNKPDIKGCTITKAP